MLLPAAMLPRRAQSLAFVAGALMDLHHGAGYAQVAEQAAVSVETVRRWVRTVHARADTLAPEVESWTLSVDLSHQAGFARPTGTRLGDVLEALGRAHAAARLRLAAGREQLEAWHVLGVVLRGCLLAPLRT